MEEVVIWPSTEDLITPERLKKGDVRIKLNARSKISWAAQVDASVVRELIKLEWLERHHEIYGLGYLELRTAFRSPQLEKSCAVLLAQWGKGISNSRAGEIFQNVTRGMTAKGIVVVTHACEQHKSKIGNYEKGVYQEHFERLAGLMDEERDRVKNEEP